MSYDVELIDPETKACCEVELHAEGGTYAMNGTTNADLNITYNYGSFFYKHLDAERGLRWLYGKTGAETAPRLESAVAALGTEQAEDYWEPTPGNAGYALSILLKWARQHPNGVWQGD